MWVYQRVSENMFHLVNECDQARKSHTRARLYITACFKTIWHLHSGQDLVPLVSAIASKISMVQIKNAKKKKRTTKHLQNVQDVVIIPICRPTLHLCHTIPLPYRILLVMGPLKKKNKACGWPKAPGFHGIPSGTQTWFAGKSTIYGGLSNKTLHLQGVFHCHASACLTTRGAFPFFLIIGGSCPPWKNAGELLQVCPNCAASWWVW